LSPPSSSLPPFPDDLHGAAAQDVREKHGAVLPPHTQVLFFISDLLVATGTFF
jgi:hypothetical protein